MFWKRVLAEITANSNVHVFMDEVAFRQSGGMTADLMKQLAESIDKNNYLWVACKSDCSPCNNSDLEGELNLTSAWAVT